MSTSKSKTDALLGYLFPTVITKVILNYYLPLVIKYAHGILLCSIVFNQCMNPSNFTRLSKIIESALRFDVTMNGDVMLMSAMIVYKKEYVIYYDLEDNLAQIAIDKYRMFVYAIQIFDKSGTRKWKRSDDDIFKWTTIGHLY